MTRKTLTAGAIAGSLVLAGTGVGVSVAASSAKSYTLSFTSKTLKSHNFTKTTYADVSRDTAKGKVIGFDTTSGKYNVSTKKVTGVVAVSLKGGQLFGTFSGDTTSGEITGKITGGAGRFKGAHGTISGKVLNSSGDKERIALTYRK